MAQDPQEQQSHASANAAGSLLATIESITGQATFVDLGFPRCGVAGNGMIGTQMLRLPRTVPDHDFLLRFRQAGGHLPITALNLGDRKFAWPPTFTKDGDAIVVCFEDPASAADVGRRLLAAGSYVLVPLQANDAMSALGSRLGHRGVRLSDIDDGPSYEIFLPEQSRDKASSKFALDVQAVSFRFGSSITESRSMIHDGGYVSEGDAGYSWLWTGPSTHFRLMLPQIAGKRPRKAEVCVPRTEDSINLDRLAVQLDGCPIEHHLERWSATSGKITVDIPASHDYAVMTLIAPKPSPDGNSNRLLGLCLDKMILTP